MAGKLIRVLVVDDEPAVLDSIEAVLSEDVDVVTCTSPQKALMVFKREEFHVVCSDFNMPGMNGIELLKAISAIQPNVGRLLITGAVQQMSPEDGARHYVLLKPFNPERLIALVLQLGRIAHMRRSVGTLSESVADANPFRRTGTRG